MKWTHGDARRGLVDSLSPQSRVNSLRHCALTMQATVSPIFYFLSNFLGPRSYLVSDTDALKQILVSKSFKYYRPTEDTRIITLKNVLRANGKEHSRMRKMINPVFKVNNLKSMVDIFHKKAKLLAKVKGQVLVIIPGYYWATPIP